MNRGTWDKLQSQSYIKIKKKKKQVIWSNSMLLLTQLEACKITELMKKEMTFNPFVKKTKLRIFTKELRIKQSTSEVHGHR